ncbi:MAG: 50S ribosomal protein L17 [Firmicutes bacterium]|nr:50S ribosomal protein L17 [Bacillota bacterium]
MPKVHRKLGRPGDQRRAMLRSLVTSLLKEERITTTVARAHEVNRVAEHMVTLGKRGDLAARRQALAYILEEDVVSKLFTTIAPRYTERSGGYTRIMRTGFRRGDAAPMAILELV